MIRVPCRILKKYGCARSYTAQTLWVDGSWVNSVFLKIFWPSVVRWSLGQLCFLEYLLASYYDRSSLHRFFFSSDVLGCTWLTLSGWVELGPTKIYEVIFWRVLMHVMIGILCTRFFLFFRSGRSAGW